ncbi:invasion associated locus B family protein [Methylocystis bryophila]|uniref:invasion associated locus B family protein n=1 Tax=Methylocystis bryophila TaxID=655015 RepID=UPI00131A1B93|nr:invasion associated locus B family protein [Methylocystis bryophila]
MPSMRKHLAALALFVAIWASSFAHGWAKERGPAVVARGPARSELTAAGPGWVKVCFEDPRTRRQTCYTTRDFAEEGGTPILSLEVFETKGEESMLLRAFLPLGLALKPGVRIGLERGEQENGAFDACFPAGCYASSNVAPALVDAMKRGGRIRLSVKKLSGEELDFFLPLEGFGKAFDGPGAAAEEIGPEPRKRLQDELVGRAAAERRRLEGEGGPKPPTPPAEASGG